MQTLRTPEERFADLPGYAYTPHYATTSDGLRMAYVDEGSGPVVVLLHGEPTWGYLYRTMLPVLVEAGYRCVVPDLIGFGRSDKPTELSDYTYERHVEWVRSVLFDTLDLTDVTLFCQDWGGLLGLRLVAEHPDRFGAVCASNTGLPDGRHRMPDPWWKFRDFVVRTPELPVGFLVSRGCVQPVAPEVAAAYDAPFPDASYQAGAKAFPDLIPQTEDDVATPANQAAWEALKTFSKPVLTAFSDGDPITAGGDRVLRKLVPGTADQPHTTIEGGGHFVQEDRGPELAAVLVAWLAGLDRDGLQR